MQESLDIFFLKWFEMYGDAAAKVKLVDHIIPYAASSSRSYPPALNGNASMEGVEMYQPMKNQ